MGHSDPLGSIPFMAQTEGYLNKNPVPKILQKSAMPIAVCTCSICSIRRRGCPAKPPTSEGLIIVKSNWCATLRLYRTYGYPGPIGRSNVATTST